MKCYHCDSILTPIFIDDERFYHCTNKSHEHITLQYYVKNDSLLYIRATVDKKLSSITYILSNINNKTSTIVFKNKVVDINLSLFSDSLTQFVEKFQAYELFS